MIWFSWLFPGEKSPTLLPLCDALQLCMPSVVKIIVIFLTEFLKKIQKWSIKTKGYHKWLFFLNIQMQIYFYKILFHIGEFDQFFLKHLDHEICLVDSWNESKAGLLYNISVFENGMKIVASLSHISLRKFSFFIIILNNQKSLMIVIPWIRRWMYLEYSCNQKP